jgi:hypothetical protein
MDTTNTRRYFAAMAMQGLISSGKYHAWNEESGRIETSDKIISFYHDGAKKPHTKDLHCTMTEIAFEIADDMLRYEENYYGSNPTTTNT